MCEPFICDTVADPITKRVVGSESFTAYEITRDVRAIYPQVSVPHREVRRLVHGWWENTLDIGYDRTLANLPGISPQPWVYHPEGADLSRYGIISAEILPPRPPPRKPLLGIREKLDQPVTLERGITNVALQDAVATLSDRYGTPIGINQGEYACRGLPSPETLPINLPELKGGRLQLVLERIAGQVKGKLRIERESVVIT